MRIPVAGCVLVAGLAIAGRNAGAFEHPGITSSKAELDFIKAKVNGREEPWASGWAKMMSFGGSSLGYRPNPCASFTFDTCRNQLRENGAAAYSHALQYYVKGNPENARKVIEILVAWATTTKFKQSCLAATWGIHRMVAGAEIVRHSFPEWSDEKTGVFANWLRDEVWPFASGCESDRSNWDAGGIANSIFMAIYLDDRAKFDAAIKRLTSFIPVYVRSPSGCTNETDRDQGHTQMGLGFLAEACEAAWHQGVDAWSAQGNRLAAGYELTAKYNLGNDVIGCCASNAPNCGVSSTYRGNFAPVWEMPHNHYVNRMKMDLPYLAMAVKKARPEGIDIHMLPWGTLTYANLPALNDGGASPPRATESRDAGLAGTDAERRPWSEDAGSSTVTGTADTASGAAQRADTALGGSNDPDPGLAPENPTGDAAAGCSCRIGAASDPNGTRSPLAVTLLALICARARRIRRDRDRDGGRLRQRAERS